MEEVTSAFKFRLSSEFGVLERVRNGREHTGIDLAMPEGTELRSVADGIVIKVPDYGDENIGKGVVIETDSGEYHIYGHMSDVDVRVGEKVSVGEYLGESGNTGHSTGPHLHFGVKENGEFVDPSSYRETLDALSGDVEVAQSSLFSLGSVFNPVDSIKQKVAETTKDKAAEWAVDALQFLGQLVGELSYSITLIGGGFLIVLYLTGMRRAGRWFSVMYVSNVVITYMFK